MVKLASARECRTYGPRLARSRAEYINAGLHLFATVVLVCGFTAQFSWEPRSGLFLALVEFSVPVVQVLGSQLFFLGILFLLIQAEKGYGFLKLEKHALRMLIAGPVLWVLGSIHNSCQIYERADGHVQILQQSVHIPFLIGSLLFLVGAILNSHEQAGIIHHGLQLLGKTWVCLGICGSLMFFIGGLTNVVKVFKMQQINGLRLEKLRGGAQDRLIQGWEGQVPLIIEERWRKMEVEEIKAAAASPASTPYKDVLLGGT
ncbi:uncharacterized protein LOC111309364 isoform X2 [Durio zibethinus]|uniref:Uncharacterized protein LOC111309364 isoform X2 n=1 Tax=Durio zibethinus TaxID=66656 RepID=A0A6P6AH26_DURZI|nr:uncharacterized protein LOC111309364 isoform X2 [Durio zibethinus]